MPRFTYAPEAARRRKRTFALLVSVPTVFAVVFALLVSLVLEPGAPTADYLWLVLVIIGTAGTYGFFKIRYGATSEASLEITIDADRIIKDQLGKKSIEILRSERPQLSELPGEGLWVDSADRTKSIFVPTRFTGYSEIKSTLTAWCPFVTKPDRTYIGYLVLGGAILFLILILTESTRVYALAFGYVLLVLILSIPLVQHFRRRLQRRRLP
jgi:hypothetical protein